LSGDSFAPDPIDNNMESQLRLEPTDLHTQLNVNPMPDFHTWQTEQSPVAHNDLNAGSDFELILEHSQSTLDRPLVSDSPPIESVTPATRIRRHTCGRCGVSFRSRKDVDRHHRSIHEKSTPYVCYEAGCHRSGRGFPRKDNYEKHLRNVHQKHSKSSNAGIYYRREGKESDLTEHGLEGYSRRQLVDMLVAERQQCRNQQNELQAAKDELMKLKNRLEQREDMWLKALVAKETK
jgi:uncharacterized C2H2 Zn-finger protein